ncbi:MAG: hypothetical protein ACKO3K_20485 [Cuspidothrix sp.]
MFVQLVNKISDQIHYEISTRYQFASEYDHFYPSLYLAITAWCDQFRIDKDASNYILQGHRFELEELTNLLYQEWKPKKRERLTFSGWESYLEISKLYKLLRRIFDNHRMSKRNENMKIIVLIGFVIVAVGYWLYVINRQKEQTQQPTCRPEPRQNENVSTSPSPAIQTPPVQRIKQFLVLVISASQIDFLKSILAKGQISFSDGEQLYELTKYLWTGSETDYQQRISNINRYSVSPEEESEYDICLVYIELQRTDLGFNPNVNQLDRYDAFRKLNDLTINFQISPRLQMEAYGNFEVYSR